MAEKQMEQDVACKSEGHDKHLCHLMCDGFHRWFRMRNLDAKIAAELQIKANIFANLSNYRKPLNLRKNSVYFSGSSIWV
jgi:hypothetical protein